MSEDRVKVFEVIEGVVVATTFGGQMTVLSGPDALANIMGTPDWSPIPDHFYWPKTEDIDGPWDLLGDMEHVLPQAPALWRLSIVLCGPVDAVEPDHIRVSVPTVELLLGEQIFDLQTGGPKSRGRGDYRGDGVVDTAKDARARDEMSDFDTYRSSWTARVADQIQEAAEARFMADNVIEIPRDDFGAFLVTHLLDSVPLVLMATSSSQVPEEADPPDCIWWCSKCQKPLCTWTVCEDPEAPRVAPSSCPGCNSNRIMPVPFYPVVRSAKPYRYIRVDWKTSLASAGRPGDLSPRAHGKPMSRTPEGGSSQASRVAPTRFDGCYRPHSPETVDEVRAMLEDTKAGRTWRDVSKPVWKMIDELARPGDVGRLSPLVEYAAACYALGRMDEREESRPPMAELADQQSHAWSALEQPGTDVDDDELIEDAVSFALELTLETALLDIGQRVAWHRVTRAKDLDGDQISFLEEVCRDLIRAVDMLDLSRESKVEHLDSAPICEDGPPAVGESFVVRDDVAPEWTSRAAERAFWCNDRLARALGNLDAGVQASVDPARFEHLAIVVAEAWRDLNETTPHPIRGWDHSTVDGEFVGEILRWYANRSSWTPTGIYKLCDPPDGRSYADDIHALATAWELRDRTRRMNGGTRSNAVADELIRLLCAEMREQDRRWGWPRPDDFLMDVGAEDSFDIRAMMMSLEASSRAQLDERPSWLSILGEEVGEMAREEHPAKRVAELIQIAAVCMSFAQHIREWMAKGGAA